MSRFLGTLSALPYTSKIGACTSSFILEDSGNIHRVVFLSLSCIIEKRITTTFLTGHPNIYVVHLTHKTSYYLYTKPPT